MSLTAYTKVWSLALGVASRRWHLNEKLLLVASMSLKRKLKVINENYCASFSSTYLEETLRKINRDFMMTYWMATRPSTLPTAKPLLTGLVVKHETTRVCHFKGDTIVYTSRISQIKRTMEATTCLVGGVWICEVEYLDVTFGCPNNHKRILHIEGIASFW